MKLHSLVRVFAQISLVFTFIVVIAGSVVRMTGSGMGCPDWPKCFGYMIPPTDAEDLQFATGKNFFQGQMVIMNDTLWVANENFLSKDAFDRTQWHKYPKHDYAIFNPLHTWVEYANRLATVVYAFPILILSVLCLLLLIREKDKITFFLALFVDIMIAYEIWLGKLVVDGNLKENSISLHMLGSIAIISLLLMLVYRHRKDRTEIAVAKNFRGLLIAILLMSFFQVILGTQVREQVDIVAKYTDDRGLWIDMLPMVFKLHRSFSILVTLCVVALFVANRKLMKPIRQINGLVFLVLMEIVIGVVLSYFSMPKELQPLHLLLGVMMFAFAFYSYLRIRKSKANS
jgi:cytochrome c oxidase assembly protein subunit 15